MRIASLTALLALAGVLTACDESAERVLGINATGNLRGSAYLDRDGDGKRTQVDSVFRGLRVAILPNNGSAPVATVVTDSLGQFHAKKLPVGNYWLSPDQASVGDSVHVERIDSARVTLAANDTAESVIVIGYNTPSLLQIAILPRGTRVAFFATALNNWSSFGDSTVHFADPTGAIRAVGLPPSSIAAGDAIRATATVGENAGKPALTNLTVVSRASGDLPLPLEVTTAAASRAGGRLDAAQVRIRAAIVLGASSLAGGDVLFIVDDRNGPLDVLVDASAAIATSLPVTPGAELDVTGVLVPGNDGSGRWRLKPRFTGDVIVRYLPVTIASARTRQPGQFVMVHGIVLNDLLTFGDRTVHVADATGAIRVLNPSGFFTVGDSVSVLGLLDIGAGVQPVLNGASFSVLARRAVPPPFALTTLRAATADSGQRDAALVRVSNTLVDTIAGGGRRLNDGSGFVDLVPPTFFPLPAAGARVDVTGLLVPVAPGRWVIRPRSAADVVVR